QNIEKPSIAFSIQMLDGELIRLLLISAFFGIGARQWQVQSESYCTAGRIVAEFLRPRSSREYQRCDTGSQDAGQAGLNDITAGDAALECAHRFPPPWMREPSSQERLTTFPISACID